MKQSSAILWAVCLGYSMVILDTSILNVALPSIAAESGASGVQQQWIIDAYVLVMTSLLLAGGGLIDRFGAKRVFNTGISIFALSSLACALTNDASVLIIARAIQGIGGALLIPATLAIIVTFFTDAQERGKAIAIVATVTASPQAFGPTLGGILVDTLGWRSIFLLNIPIAIVALFFGKRIPVGVAHKRSLDIPGVILIALALGSVTYAIINFTDTWQLGTSSYIALGVFLASFIGFFILESKTERPLIPHIILKAPTVNLYVLCGTFMFILFYGALFAANLYFQKVLSINALVSGLLLLPAGAPVFILPIIVSKVAKGKSPFTLTLTGTIISTVGASLALLVLIVNSPLLIAISLLIVGIGFGIASPPHLNLVTSVAPEGTAGIISALANAGRQAGYLLGVAAVGMAGISLMGYTQASIVATIGGIVAILMMLSASRISVHPQQETT